MSVRSDEVQSVVDQVKKWPREKRVELAQGILATLGEEPRRGNGNLQNLLGLLPSEGARLSDEDIDRLLEDELIGKYGS